MGQQIDAANGEGIEAEFGGHLVHQRLKGGARIDGAVAALGAAGRSVGVDAPAIMLDRRNVVDAVQQRAGIEDGDDAVARVGAAALHGLQVAGGQLAVPGHAELDGDLGLGPTAMGEKSLLAGLQQSHGAARLARQQAGDNLEIQAFGARAEAAADERLDHPDMRFLHLQASCDLERT